MTVGVVLALTFAGNVQAADFTGRDFNRWTHEQKAAYVQTSMAMASTMAGQLSQNFATCLNDWYFTDTGVRAGRDDVILDVIRKHPRHHPSATIMATLINVCGHTR